MDYYIGDEAMSH